MIKNCFTLLCCLLLINCALAYADSSKNPDSDNLNCVLTITKPKSWYQQTVIINLLDFKTKQVIQTFDLQSADPDKNQKGIFSVSKTFNCEVYPQTQLQAHYFPVIWSTNKGRKYLSKEVFKLENQIEQAKKNNAKNLQIDVSFPNDFNGVPLQTNI